MKIFVINLERSPGRRRLMEKQLGALGLSYQIVEAVEGKALSEEEIDRYCDKTALRLHPAWLSRGAIGCALSHLKAYQAIVDQNLPYGLVLEDDTVLEPALAAFLPLVAAHLHASEVLMLYYAAWQKCVLTAKDASVIGKHRIATPLDPKQIISGNAYIITNQACRQVIKYQTPVKVAADAWNEYFEKGAIEHIRCVYPMLADVADYKSTIDYVSGHSIKGAVLNYIDTYRIFPVYQLLKRRRKKLRTAMLNFELREQ
jgi:glycosyl transferase family 25